MKQNFLMFVEAKILTVTWTNFKMKLKKVQNSEVNLSIALLFSSF